MKTSTILLAGLAVLCAAPAFAETASVPVSFSGLDLSSNAGQDILNRRVNQATRTVCGTPDPRDLAAVRATRNCRIAALTLAQPRIAIAIAASQKNVQLATAR